MIVTALGLIISLFAFLIAFPNAQHRRFEIYAPLLVVHLLACVAYWLMSFESAVDAYTYWRDPYNFMKENPLESGTYFIVQVVQTMKGVLGGSFLDHFFFFQCFGMVGIALLIRMFSEISESLQVDVPLIVYLVLFLPGLHFWSVAIGKDGPMMMATCLSLWAALRVQRRAFWMVVAIVIMALIRPHVAAITVMAIVAGLLLSKQLPHTARLFLAPITLIGLVLVVARASERFNVTDTESFTNFVEQQQDLGEKFGSGADLQALPLPLKVWSLLFRPFFLDAEGMMGYAASIENLAFLTIFAYIAYHWRLVYTLAKNVFYVTYAIVFGIVLILLLSLVNYNIGLGLRQKMMAMPAVLLIFASIYLYKRYLANAGRQMTMFAADTDPSQPIVAASG